MKTIYNFTKKLLNVKQHWASTKSKYPMQVKFVQFYLVFASIFVLLGTNLTTWLEQPNENEMYGWIFFAALPLLPLLIPLMLLIWFCGMVLGFVVIFAPIWIPIACWLNFSEKQEKETNENVVKEQLQAQIERAKKIGIEQAKPENKVWLSKSPGIYFDGHKIIIKTDYDAEIVKSIKGMHRRAWEPAIKAWICPIDEYANVLGISKRFKLKLDETFANIHQSTNVFVDASIPGSNAHMLKLHNDGKINLSLKKTLKSDEGYVYIIRATDGSGIYKIGKSTTPDRRVKTVIGQMPMKCEALHCAWFEDHGYAEKLLHNMYSDKRVSSEWFNLPDEDVAFILSLGQKYDLNPTEEQISERHEMERKRRDNYREFKDRENRRNSKNSRSYKNRHNPNRW